MSRKIPALVAMAVLAGAMVGPAGAPAQQILPASPADASVEGVVKKVHPDLGTVEVTTGASSGLWVKSLAITGDTQIQIEGRKASLEDIPEGSKIKASYDTRAGKSFAVSIDVLPPPEPGER